MPLLPELEQSLISLSRNYVDIAKKEFTRISDKLTAIRWCLLSSKDEKCSVAAVDSSFTLVESRLGLIYVVQGIAEGWIEGRSVHVRIADAGIIDVRGLYTSYGVRRLAPKHVLSTYAQLLELKALKKLLDIYGVPDIALLDGSAISFLLNRARKAGDAAIISTAGDRYLLKEVVFLKEELIAELSKRCRLLFVAKSSGASLLIDGYPDLYVLEMARVMKLEPFRRAGRTNVVEIPSDRLAKVVRIDSKRLEELGIKAVKVLYVRLRDDAQTFQISYLNEIEDLERALRCLKYWSPMGYPIPLESTHRMSKISRKGLRYAMMRLGIPIVSGREAIE